MDDLQYIVAGQDLCINSQITVRNPTLGEIMAYGEQQFIADVGALVLRPYDAMVMLDDCGQDYRNIKDYDLFLMTIRASLPDDSILLPGIHTSRMQLGINPDNGLPILMDPETFVIIDEAIYQQIVDYVRQTNFIPSTVEVKAGNTRAKNVLVEMARKKLKKNANKKYDSQLSYVLSSLINNANFKYDYANVWGMHISQLWDAFYRVSKLHSYQNTMLGIYTGNLQPSKLDNEMLNWFGKIDINAEKVDKSQVVAATN